MSDIRAGVRAMARVGSGVAAAGLGGLAAVHVLWGLGSPWPVATTEELADVVAGQEEMPGAPACFAVAAALATATALTAGAGGSRAVARVGRTGVGAVLLMRGAVGVTGRPKVLTATSSERFARLDRRFYSPASLTLGSLVILGLLGERRLPPARSQL